MCGVDDTSREAEQVQLESLRRMSPDRRLAAALALSEIAIELSKRALRRLHPAASSREIAEMWARHHYGPEIADRWKQASR